MNFILSKWLFYVMFYLFIHQSWAQSTDNLSKKLTKIQKKSNLPGFSLVILHKDSAIFAGGFGFANKKLKTPYTLSTIQPIGSVSKTFVGFALVKAIELGFFDLETDINEILPFKIANPNFDNFPIKVKHLVTHTSSLVDSDSAYFLAYNLGEKPNLSLEGYLRAYYLPKGAFYSIKNFGNERPGANYSYSNVASALAAFLIEIKAKQSFSEFTKKYIFEPLKMEDTDWFYNESLSPKYATLYEVNKPFDATFESFINSDGSLKTYACATYPDGALRTSAADLTKYIKELVNGINGQSTLLNGKSYISLFEKRFSEANKPNNIPANEPNRAVFWGINRKDKWVHTGSDSGLTAFVSIDPLKSISRILLFNANLDGENNKKTILNFKKIIAEIDEFEGQIK